MRMITFAKRCTKEILRDPINLGFGLGFPLVLLLLLSALQANIPVSIFEKITNVLPFVHAVEMEKALFHGNFEVAASHILPILLYSVCITVVAVSCFLHQMKKQ